MVLRRTLTRRSLLLGAAAGFVASRARPGRASAGYPFTLGLASGNPTADGIVPWTRLAPEPLSPDPSHPGGMAPIAAPVRWEIADDPAMRRVIRQGVADAEPQFAHSVHVELAGLEPARDYWYRFTVGDAASPIGHTRTAPSRTATTGRLRFAFASCANYEHGYFSAYRHLAAEMPELVLFLGDYIYESVSQSPRRVRSHSDGVETTDLRTYRNRHAQYKTDPDLQLLHAAAPCLAIWDDHEVQNDYADRWAVNFADPAAFLVRRAAAYRAFWEHMPLPRSALPNGPDATIHGRFDFSDLVSFLLLDGRQYRSRLACDTGPRGGAKQLVDAACPERLDPRRSYLGMAQEAWLYDQFRSGSAGWNVVAQQQMMTEFKQLESGAVTHWSDDWNGYPAARHRLLSQMRDTGLANPVVIGGDIHSFFANDLKLDFDDPRAPAIASELIGSSITSVGPPHGKFVAWVADNPHIRFFESRRRGYVSVDLRPSRMEVAFRVVANVRDADSDAATLQRFVVEAGRPGPLPA